MLNFVNVLTSSFFFSGYNKTIFEYLQVTRFFIFDFLNDFAYIEFYLQNELEVSVETLSGLVGRHYLRGSRQRITTTTQLVASRRHRFLVCISRGLLPPETPPNARKGRRRHLPAILGLDKDDVSIIFYTIFLHVFF